LIVSLNATQLVTDPAIFLTIVRGFLPDNIAAALVLQNISVNSVVRGALIVGAHSGCVLDGLSAEDSEADVFMSVNISALQSTATAVQSTVPVQSDHLWHSAPMAVTAPSSGLVGKSLRSIAQQVSAQVLRYARDHVTAARATHVGTAQTPGIDRTMHIHIVSKEWSRVSGAVIAAPH